MARPRAQQASSARVSSAGNGAQAAVAAPDGIAVGSVSELVFGENFGLDDFQAQPAAWICGGIIALLSMTVVLTFGFSFGTLVRSHNTLAEAISGFVLFATAGLAMLAAVYGGSMMAEEGKRHDLRFAILLLVFAVELVLFLAGEALGKPKGVTWLLFGAIVVGLGLWARLRYDRLLSRVADMTADLD
jgi:hypothetical protein